jgi:hypothetical protein
MALDEPSLSRLLIRRATLLREWLMFLETYAVLVMPSASDRTASATPRLSCAAGTAVVHDRNGPKHPFSKPSNAPTKVDETTAACGYCG